jgi:pyruvate dehydrogenase E2 component (dihydrolipoamide acetyltransferase)
MIPSIMPQVGQDIPTGTIVEWRKQVNDRVAKGETILTVESEKATFEVEAEQSGVLLKILHPAGAEVPVLQPVGYLGEPGEMLDGDPAPPATRSDGAVAPAGKSDEPDRASAAFEAAADRALASPAVRRLARESGVDLTRVAGSGPSGRILREDVLSATAAAAVETPAESPAEDRVVPFGRMRKRIAQRLTASKQSIPHFYLLVDVDMTEAARWRLSFNAEHGTRISITDLFIKAAAVALRQFPRLNAHVGDEQVTLKWNIHIGVAVSVDDGLMVPVIPDADRKSLEEISDLSKANSETARRGVRRLGPAGTFTVTSLGMHGVKQFVPIINPPEAAILAIGMIEPRVVPVSGGIGVREMATLTLACDHRSVDGADAAGLLNKIKSELEGIQGLQEPWTAQSQRRR